MHCTTYECNTVHWSCTGHALVMLVSRDFEHTYVSVCGASTLLDESECGIHCINILHKFSSLAIIILYQKWTLGYTGIVILYNV